MSALLDLVNSVVEQRLNAVDTVEALNGELREAAAAIQAALPVEPTAVTVKVKRTRRTKAEMAAAKAAYDADAPVLKLLAAE